MIRVCSKCGKVHKENLRGQFSECCNAELKAPILLPSLLGFIGLKAIVENPAVQAALAKEDKESDWNELKQCLNDFWDPTSSVIIDITDDDIK